MLLRARTREAKVHQCVSWRGSEAGLAGLAPQLVHWDSSDSAGSLTVLPDLHRQCDPAYLKAEGGFLRQIQGWLPLGPMTLAATCLLCLRLPLPRPWHGRHASACALVQAVPLRAPLAQARLLPLPFSGSCRCDCPCPGHAAAA